MFKPIELEWHGKPVVIPANRALGAIATVEGIITGQEIQGFLQRGGYPAARVAQAFGALLRYAGETVTDDEVYRGLFNDGPKTERTVGSMNLLLMMMIPPDMLNGAIKEPVLAPGETAPGNSQAASRKRSSRPTTTASSRKAGARR